MLVVVHGRTNSGILSVDGAFDPNMREALANAAQRYGLPVGLPSATLQSNQISLDTTKVAPGDRLSKVAELSLGVELEGRCRPDVRRAAPIFLCGYHREDDRPIR
ncbi:MAG: hypothetical protein WCB26_15605, partial [Pseudolabrys sp.]